MALAAVIGSASPSIAALPPVSHAEAQNIELALRERHAEAVALEKRLSNVEGYFPWVFLPLTVLVGLIGAGSAIGIVLSFKQEGRQAELQGFTRAAAARDADTHKTFFEGSQRTLDLVNETLALANQASERAAEAMRQTTNDELNELDRAAGDVLERVYEEHDFKVVVKVDSLREELEEIARSLTQIAGHFKMQRIDLTPRCLFVKGLDLHLKGASKAAINSLKGVETDKDPELSALALYWAAYESNNLGHFGLAADLFQRARERYVTNTQRAQHHELERCQIQSRFFEIAREQSVSSDDRSRMIEELVNELRALTAKLQDASLGEVVAERRHCEETLGDLFFWAARQSPLDRGKSEGLSSSERALLEQAAQHYKAGGTHIWSQFGLAQTHWALSGKLDGRVYNRLHGRLMALGDAHREPRTRALRHLATFISEAEQGERENVLGDTKRLLWGDVHHVSGDMRMFSPWQKRNATKEEFIREMEQYFERPSGGNGAVKDEISDDPDAYVNG